MNKILRKIEKFIPKKVFTFFQPAYHFMLALAGEMVYRSPGEKIKVVAITGTKGKTSTAEFINAILEEAGKKTALAGTLRFKVADKSEPNKFKMTMPGRFFTQKFLRRSVNARCEYAILEISSEAAKQYRHRFIDLNALIFTNMAPEHIESHGSYEKYLKAKLSIAKALEKSTKKNKVIIVNTDDAEAPKFLDINIQNKITYSLKDAANINLENNVVNFTYKNTEIKSELPGKFNIYNMLAAIKYAESEGISLQTARKALENLKVIRGRAESINIGPKQDFKVVVDYAHTPDSLKAIYEAFPKGKRIGVLGSCGGGRDKWKRKEMMEIAEKYCEKIILTDEDPYNDNPREIVDDLAGYFKNKKPEIIMDRRQAIAKSIRYAKSDDAVIITGKGTDPYIMRANGAKEKWSDAEVAKEELNKLFR